MIRSSTIHGSGIDVVSAKRDRLFGIGSMHGLVTSTTLGGAGGGQAGHLREQAKGFAKTMASATRIPVVDQILDGALEFGLDACSSSALALEFGLEIRKGIVSLLDAGLGEDGSCKSFLLEAVRFNQGKQVPAILPRQLRQEHDGEHHRGRADEGARPKEPCHADSPFEEPKIFAMRRLIRGMTCLVASGTRHFFQKV